jgi:hypothetical protein
MTMKLHLGLALIAILSPVPTATAGIRTVALSGQAAAGTPTGAKFASFTPPVIDAAGRTAFRGSLQTGVGGVNASSAAGVWSERTGALNLVARASRQAPGTPMGADFNGFSPLSMAPDGKLAFKAALIVGDGGVTTSNNSGLWSEASGNLALVVRESEPIPRAPSGVAFDFTTAPMINRARQASFRAAAVSGEIGIWKENNETLTAVVVTGDQAPGTADGVTFSNFTNAVKFSSTGATAFRGTLAGPGVSVDNASGLWVERNNSLKLVARRGNLAMPGLYFHNIGEPALNGRGQTAFLAAVTGAGVAASNKNALWAEKENVLSLVARAGTQAPGLPAGVMFDVLGEPLLNADSDVAFTASIVGTGISDDKNGGIWVRRDGVLGLVAAKGALAVGGPQDAPFSAFDDVSLNSAGQVAFRATLSPSLVAPESEGIWATALGGVLKLIARKGQAIEVAPGSTKTIASLSLNSGTNEDGHGSAFSDRGELAFAATFTDGSSGVFVSDAVKSSPGDFDGDLDFDGADFLAWQRAPRDLGAGHPGNGDANDDGNVTTADLDVWKTRFGTSSATTMAGAAVPEPSGLALAACLSAGLAVRRRC